MIRVKLPNDIVVECDTAIEAAEVVKQSTYTPAQQRVIEKALCASGTHIGDNHCYSCGKCLHAGMC
jgi:hypothetical protein